MSDDVKTSMLLHLLPILTAYLVLGFVISRNLLSSLSPDILDCYVFEVGTSTSTLLYNKQLKLSLQCTSSKN